MTETVPVEDLRGYDGEVRDCYKRLHGIPELGFEEHETSEFISSKLDEYGFEKIRTKVGGTGVIADLVSNPGGETLMLRADMDALPIRETTCLDYASRKDGMMHACGHDAHSAMLLGAAKYLISNREKLRGNVRFVFQPAEEGPSPGGASVLIENGVLNEVSACIVLHVTPLYRSGHIMLQPDRAMASTDKFVVRIIGRGGHSGMPHRAISPIPALSGFISALDTVCSGEVDPTEECVITVGTVHTSPSSWNAIPSEAEITGSFRMLSPEVRRMVDERLGDLAKGISASFRCGCEYRREVGYDPVVNDPGLVKFLADTLHGVRGLDNVIFERKAFMTGEDAGAYFRQIPGALVWIGCAGSDRKAPELHSPLFEAALDSLLFGVCVHVNCAINYFRRQFKSTRSVSG